LPMLPTTESVRPEMSLEWRLAEEAEEAEVEETAEEAVVVAAIVAGVAEEV
jgi:hypothetical protein